MQSAQWYQRTSIHQTNLFCICPSFIETNLNKAKKGIYEKLSRVFTVAGSRFEEKQSHQLQYFWPSIFQLQWKTFYLVIYSWQAL